jgi:nucleoside-diphosphate-sugar epimerase
MVLAANSRHLATVAVRPHLVFGPRDQNVFPRVIARARAGRLVKIGRRPVRIDLTYVDNAAWAHLDAERALTDHTAPCAGTAYFISNDEPVEMWAFVNELLEGVGVDPVTRSAPFGLVRGAAGLMAFLWRTFPLKGEPPLTPFLVDGLAREHWYDMGPAKRDLGYTVRVPLAEGLKRTIDWLREQETAEPAIPEVVSAG